MHELVDRKKRILIFLSILKLNLKRGHSAIDILVYFISILFIEKKYNAFDIDLLMNDFTDFFGYSIPLLQIKSIVHRAEKLHFIQKNKNNNTYTIYQDVLNNNTEIRELLLKSQEQLKNQDIFIQDFIDFAKNKFNKVFDKESATNLMLDFLKKHSNAILFKDSIENNETQNDTDFYFFARYIHELLESQREKFLEILHNISWGYIIASVLIKRELSEEIEDSSFENVSILIDAPIIFNLIGANGDDIQKDYINLIDILKKKKAKLYTLDYIVWEVKEILDNAIGIFYSPSYDPKKAGKALKYAKEYRNRDFLEGIRDSVDTKLSDYNITVEEQTTCTYDNYSYMLNESDLMKKIEDFYSQTTTADISENKKDAIKRDIQSINEIFIRRKDTYCNNILESKHFLLTNNYALIRISKNDIPAAISDTLLAGIIYIYLPQENITLNETKLIADCFAYLPANDANFNYFVSILNETVDQNMKFLMTTKDFKIFLKDVIVSESLSIYTREKAEKILNEFKSRLKKESEDIKTKLALEEAKTKSQEKELNRKNVVEKFQKNINIIIGILIFFVLIILIVFKKISFDYAIGLGLVGVVIFLWNHLSYFLATLWYNKKK